MIPLLFQVASHVAHHQMHTANSHVLSLGPSHLTEGCHMQDQLKDTARITSQVNWRYNQRKRKGLVERLQLLNCCNSEICTRT